MTDNIPRTAEEYRAWWIANTDVPFGYCWCGCGGATNLAQSTRKDRPAIRNMPVQYLPTHNRRRFSVPYVEEDRGYHTPCWVWQWKINSWGYAQGNKDGKAVKIHRYNYERTYGEIPTGLSLHHLCAPYGGPRHCVNPSHLEPVTHAANMRMSKTVKLDAQKVLEIKRRRKRGDKPIDIARCFGVHVSTIRRALNNRTWS